MDDSAKYHPFCGSKPIKFVVSIAIYLATVRYLLQCR